MPFYEGLRSERLEHVQNEEMSGGVHLNWFGSESKPPWIDKYSPYK